LFTYLGDADLESYYDENHPNDVISIDALDADIRAEAELLASEAGLTPGTTSFNNAVLDYALTGDASFIDSALTAPRVAREDYIEVSSPSLQPQPEPQPEPQPQPAPAPAPAPQPEPVPDVAQNTAPVANNDDLVGRFGWLVSGNLFVDNGNGADLDADGDEIVITAIDGLDIVFDSAIELESGATVIVQENGDFVYDQVAAFEASAGEAAVDAFEYAIEDSQGAESAAVVSVELGEMMDSVEVSVIEALYLVAFDREADAGGLEYWAGIREGGSSVLDIADFFFESDEFFSEHDDSLGDDDFLTLLYQNAFDRTPDAEGLEYWSEALEAEQVDQGDVMAYIASSDEMQTKYLAEGFIFA
ncbi:DUF4214 domain-containing protein, partial [Halomonas sp. ISL-60]|nr:DUF4214 domain-containing protein [Halomonas sp. ISL-60]